MFDIRCVMDRCEVGVDCVIFGVILGREDLKKFGEVVWGDMCNLLVG